MLQTMHKLMDRLMLQAFLASPLVYCMLPHTGQILVEDYEAVSEGGRLVPLPRTPCVSDLLARYVQEVCESLVLPAAHPAVMFPALCSVACRQSGAQYMVSGCSSRHEVNHGAWQLVV